MSTYVVSDIHGCYDELITALNAVDFAPSRGDELYIIGDIIDRGPKNAECIKWLISQDPQHVHFIKGNHEAMMLKETQGNWMDVPLLRGIGDWSINGGIDTSADMINSLSSDERKSFYEIADKAPYHMSINVNGNDYLLVHAGFLSIPYKNPISNSELNKWLDEQSEFDQIWIRRQWYLSPFTPPRTTIFGHTMVHMLLNDIFDNIIPEHDANALGLTYDNPNNPIIQYEAHGGSYESSEVLVWNKRIAIDCGCNVGGRLALLRLDDASVVYVQAKPATVANDIATSLRVNVGDLASIANNTFAFHDGYDRNSYRKFLAFKLSERPDLAEIIGDDVFDMMMNEFNLNVMKLNTRIEKAELII